MKYINKGEEQKINITARVYNYPFKRQKGYNNYITDVYLCIYACVKFKYKYLMKLKTF